MATEQERKVMVVIMEADRAFEKATRCPLCKSELQPDGSLWYCPKHDCHLFSHPIRSRGWDAIIAALTAAPEKPRRFPIMGGPSIPWEMIAPHELQAIANHGQSIQRLAERGGLSVHEALAVLTDVSYRHISGTDDEVRKRFLDIVSPPTPPRVDVRKVLAKWSEHRPECWDDDSPRPTFAALEGALQRAGYEVAE